MFIPAVGHGSLSFIGRPQNLNVPSGWKLRGASGHLDPNPNPNPNFVGTARVGRRGMEYRGEGGGVGREVAPAEYRVVYCSRNTPAVSISSVNIAVTRITVG